MSYRELCVELINEFEEEQLKNIIILLKNVKKSVIDPAEDAYCLQLLEDYENDPDSDKDDSIEIQDFAKELGINLE